MGRRVEEGMICIEWMEFWSGVAVWYGVNEGWEKRCLHAFMICWMGLDNPFKL